MSCIVQDCCAMTRVLTLCSSPITAAAETPLLTLVTAELPAAAGYLYLYLYLNAENWQHGGEQT